MPPITDHPGANRPPITHTLAELDSLPESYLTEDDHEVTIDRTAHGVTTAVIMAIFPSRELAQEWARDELTYYTGLTDIYTYTVDIYPA